MRSVPIKIRLTKGFIAWRSDAKWTGVAFFPLFNEDLSVMGIRSVTIAPKDGGVVDEVRFPCMDSAKPDRLISARIVPRYNN